MSEQGPVPCTTTWEPPKVTVLGAWGATKQMQTTRHCVHGALDTHMCVSVQVLELLLDRKAADARNSREVSAREAQIARLQEYVDQELSELQQRQAQVGLHTFKTATPMSSFSRIQASHIAYWLLLPNSGAQSHLLRPSKDL